MYPDRLVIKNPGGLFGPVTIDSLGEQGNSSARNATLIKLFEDVPLPGETRTVCEKQWLRHPLHARLTAHLIRPLLSARTTSSQTFTDGPMTFRFQEGRSSPPARRLVRSAAP